MAVTPLNIIYSWFETGDFPTEQQFQATWSSFWHKSESIPMAQIESLNNALNSYVLTSTFNSHLTDPNAHAGIFIPLLQKAAPNGVATLTAAGKIPESQLPSYVDDVIEGTMSGTQFLDENAQVISPEQGKIYIDVNTNKSYRWSGTVFAEITSGINEADLVHKTGYEYITGQKDFSNPEGSFVIGNAVLKNGYFGDEYGLVDMGHEIALAISTGSYINFAGNGAGNQADDGLNRDIATGNYGFDYTPDQDNKLGIGGTIISDGYYVSRPTASSFLDYESLKLIGSGNNRITHQFAGNVYTIRYGSYDGVGRGIPQNETNGSDVLRFNLNTATVSLGALNFSGGAPIKMKLHYTPTTTNQHSVVTIGTDNFVGKKLLSDLATSYSPTERTTGGVLEFDNGGTLQSVAIKTKAIRVFGNSASLIIGNIPVHIMITNGVSIGIHEDIATAMGSPPPLTYNITDNLNGTLSVNVTFNDFLGQHTNICIVAQYATIEIPA